MSIWKFILVDSAGVRTEVENPQGWESPEVNIDRDDTWHGIFFGYSFSQLKFVGTAYTLIKSEYETKGANGDMSLEILYQCSEDGQFDTFYFGRLSFDEYGDECGTECSVTIGLEDSNDVMLFRNNYEQKVDLNSNVAFDETTALTDYDKLNTDIVIPGRSIPLTSKAENRQTNSFDLLDYPGWENMGSPNVVIEEGGFVVIYDNPIYTEFNDTLFSPSPYYVSGILFPPDPRKVAVPPIVDLKNFGGLSCVSTDLNLQFRVKGNLQDVSTTTREVSLRFIVNVGQNPEKVFQAANILAFDYSINFSQTTPFDVSFSGPIALQPGDKIYLFGLIRYVKSGTPPVEQVLMTFDTETNFQLTGLSKCDDTETKMYFINEAISRTAEAITSDKIRFYSTLFGRTDSQPYSLLSQTCAGPFAISSGLNVRRRLLADGSQPGCFVTMKQLFDDLNSIWNIGLSIEPDKFRSGYNYLRFEDWRYFYQEDVGIIFSDASSVKRSVDTERLYNRMTVGYNKWTAEQYSGLDELMTDREYRININAISRELEVKSDMIAAPYTTEITRRLDTGTDDWQYDNDLFAFCLKEVGSIYSVETFADVAYGVENVNDPDTCYNGRISPARNAMRWFNYIMQGLRQLQNDSRLIFTKGTANYIAKFGLNECNIEGQPISENESIEIGDFDIRENGRPITFPELITFDHPLNYNLFKRIKDEPTLKFKSIIVKCNGTDIHGWIKNISYRPEEGMATITAIPKNTTQLPAVEPPEACMATITSGSVTMDNFDFEAGTADIDFTEGNAGATLWYYIVTQGGTPGAGTGFSGTTTVHPFTVSGITPGQWSVMVVPYCSETEVGQNYGYGTFDMPYPPFKIEISAQLTNFGSNNHLILTAHSVGDVPAPANISFQWGQCVVNTSIPTEACRAFPGSAIPSPTNTLNFNAGQTTVTQQSVTVTAGQSYGYITKVVIYNISGIADADIIKAAGQGWTLEKQ